MASKSELEADLRSCRERSEKLLVQNATLKEESIRVRNSYWAFNIADITNNVIAASVILFFIRKRRCSAVRSAMRE